MTTKNQEGITPEELEVNDLAGQEPLEDEGGSGLSEQKETQGGVSRKEYETLLSEIRGLQSKMDKDASAIEKRLGGQFDELRERLGIKLDPDQEREYRMYQLEQQVASLKPKEEGSAKSQPKPGVDFAEVFSAVGIAEPSPDDMKIAMENADNPLRLAALLTERKLNKPTPTPGTKAVPGKVKSASGRPDEGALLREYDSYDGKPLDMVLSSGKTVMARREEIATLLEELEQNK